MKRSTLVALAVLLLLGAYVYWMERDESLDDDIQRVFDIAAEDIVQVEITSEEPVSVEKQEGTWRIVAPIDAAADASEMDVLLENLATMELERTIDREEGLDAAEFGLDAPRLEIRFETADGTERGLRFGKDTLTPASQYAQRAGESDVLVVASYLSNNLNRSAWDLRDKAIFHVGDEVTAKRISITRDDGDLELVHEDGLWYVANPPRARADRYQATSIFQRFRRAQMVDLIAEETTDLTSYGLDPPRFVFRAELEGDDPIVLEVGNEDALDYYARTPPRPLVFLIESGLVEDLEKAASDFWSKKLVDVSVHQITRFQIDARLVERDEELWKSDGAELDKKAVEDFLYELTGTDADEIVESVPAFEPDRSVSVWTESTHEEISVSRADGDTVYVRRRGDDVTLKLSVAAWTEIEGLAALESRPE